MPSLPCTNYDTGADFKHLIQVVEQYLARSRAVVPCTEHGKIAMAATWRIYAGLGGAKKSFRKLIVHDDMIREGSNEA